MKKLDIKATSPITQKLDTILKSEGFSILECYRVIGGSGQAVNNLGYMREEGERVYLITHEPLKNQVPDFL